LFSPTAPLTNDNLNVTLLVALFSKSFHSCVYSTRSVMKKAREEWRHDHDDGSELMKTWSWWWQWT